MSTESLAHRALDHGKGILRLAPNWVPRAFCIPGRRIKLHPDDYYILGNKRGGIDERWFASTTPAMNELRDEHEGLSQVVVDKEFILLADAVQALKGELVGDRIWDECAGWPMYSKFFDNQGPLPFHIHHDDQHAQLVGQKGKPEAYYFPPQANNHGGDFPFTFFGLRPDVTKDQVADCLRAFAKGDNKITSLSAAYRLVPGTGWDVPPGVLHAPGSFCTYEPQKASDVFAMYESVLHNRQVVPEELLWKDCPKNQLGNIDYLVELIDWDLNTDPEFAKSRFMPPLEAGSGDGYEEVWVCYKSSAFSAKELTVQPGRSVTIRDAGAYGFIMMQGHGRVGEWPVETPSMIRYGQLTHDEFFVSDRAAREGVRIQNLSPSDPLVMLKHFGPGNPQMPG